MAKRLLAGLRQDPGDAIELYPQQEAFVQSDAPYSAFVAGIGSGKTYSGVVRSLRAAYGKIGQSTIPTPNLGMITAPTYPMLRDVTMRTFVEVCQPYIESINQGNMSIRLVNGSEVLLRSADNPDRLRGANLSWWYGDEAAMYRANVWSVMAGRLRQFGQRGHAWITTTPRGRDWIYNKFVDSDSPDYALFRAASTDNVYLSDEILQAWKSEYVGDHARQELNGEFIARQGLVYNEFRKEQHIVSEYPETFAEVVAGVDWGFANPGVILVGGVDGDGRIWIVNEVYLTQTRIDEWTQIASDLRRFYGVSRFYCDPSEPDYIEAFRQEGLAATKANNRVLTGLQAVKRRLSTAILRDKVDVSLLVVDQSCNNLLREIEQYEWKEHRDGLDDSVVKANDHAMDAMRYLVMAVDGPRVVKLTSKTIRYA